MKKLTSIVFTGVAVFALSGCGSSSSSNDDGNNGSNPTYEDVYLTELNEGYSIKGYNNLDEDIELIYCNNEYTYYRDNDTFAGTFFIDDDEVEMRDDIAGSYVLIVDTYDSNDESILKNDTTYACPGLGRDLTVDEITTVSCD